MKAWYNSLTLRGVALTALAIFAPRYATVIPQVAGDLTAIIGLIVTTIGRVRTAQGVTFNNKNEGQ